MKRHILDKLVEWKGSAGRKPLILTGVRQCGKTYILKEFGSKYFDDVCYINFESSSKFGDIFEYDFDVERILKEISLIKKQKIVKGRTLLIFDEIQECPKAITSLKYFCEDAGDLHLVCAGSLLGVALRSENISFPVGKVNRLSMYPLSFSEFVEACGKDGLLEILKDWQVDREIPEIYRIPMEELLKQYYIVGGMPEVVNEFAQTGDYNAVSKIQNEILSDYADDFSKHAPTSEIEKIRLIWDSIPIQLAKDNNKFVFSHVKSGKRAKDLEGALGWVKNAGLIHITKLAKNAEIPLSANADASFFKVYMSDIGLLSRRLGLTIEVLNQDKLQTFKGAIAENYVLTELVNLGKEPYFWRSGNTAELDFLFQENGKIYPIEVKAAANTQSKSYKAFCKKYDTISRGYRLSLKNIGLSMVDKVSTLSLPLYLLWNMDFYKEGIQR